MFSVLVKIISISVCAVLLVACDKLDDLLLFKNVGDPELFQDDVPFNVDEKTVDVEINNSEELSLNALQASLLTYIDSPIYRYLDKSEFPPEGSDFCQNPVSDTRSIDWSFESSRASGEAHQVGDTLRIHYENCINSAGQEVNGTLSLRYLDLGGLNDTFLPVETTYCLDRIQEEQSINVQDTYYVVGDEVRFLPQGDFTRVEVYEHSYDENSNVRSDTLRNDFTIEKKNRSIVVHEFIDAEAGALTSVDGDVVYSLYEGESEIEACQYYRRNISVEFDNFSVKQGVFTKSFFGAVEVQNVSVDLNTEGFNIVDSDFSLALLENDLRRDFDFGNYTIKLTENKLQQTYKYEVSGLLSSASLNGTVRLNTADRNRILGGIMGELPSYGTVQVLGQGLERVTVAPSGNALTLSVDSDGDASRNGASIAELSFLTTWEQLLSRDYQQLDYIAP